MKSIYLFPGKLAAVNEPAELSTILGSCVGVALYDVQAGVGGLNHYLLPEVLPGTAPNSRYGSYAMTKLIDDCLHLGAAKDRLQAQVYGGGDVLGEVKSSLEIGRRNIEMAEKVLADHGIPVRERNVGGSVGRKIIFSTKDFTVEHRLMREKEDTQDVSGFVKLKPLRAPRVLVVDDSATVRNLFLKIFEKAGLEVVGAAKDAFEAREMVVAHKPDVVTLDIEMPRMNGVTFLQKLMAHFPLPVVMVSSLDANGGAALKALELGAIEFVHKPSQYNPAVLSDLAEILVEKVRAAAALPTVKARPPSPVQADQPSLTSQRDLQLIAIGGNAGAQKTLDAILHSLPADTPPVVISHSTSTAFLEVFLEKMKPGLKVDLGIATPGEILRWGKVYFAPPSHHLRVVNRGGRLLAELSQDRPVCGQIPSSDVLFESCAEALKGDVAAVLLGGYGMDGVSGLERIQAKGGFTIAEDPGSAEFPFAPQQAVSQGFAEQILAAKDIGAVLWKVRNQKAG